MSLELDKRWSYNGVTYRVNKQVKYQKLKKETSKKIYSRKKLRRFCQKYQAILYSFLYDVLENVETLDSDIKV